MYASTAVNNDTTGICEPGSSLSWTQFLNFFLSARNNSLMLTMSPYLSYSHKRTRRGGGGRRWQQPPQRNLDRAKCKKVAQIPLPYAYGYSCQPQARIIVSWAFKQIWNVPPSGSTGLRLKCLTFTLV